MCFTYVVLFNIAKLHRFTDKKPWHSENSKKLSKFIALTRRAGNNQMHNFKAKKKKKIMCYHCLMINSCSCICLHAYCLCASAIIQAPWKQGFVSMSPLAITTEAPCHKYWKLCILEPVLTARGATAMSSRGPQLESSPCLLQVEKAHTQQQGPGTATNK